jgi:uncharacterized protein (UPF0333 family)
MNKHCKFKLKYLVSFMLALTILSIGIYYYRSDTDEGDFHKIMGSWVRPDGGYVLELKSVNKNGVIKASYFNPNPINISEAKTEMNSNIITVYIKLQAPGYNGSYYMLTYDPESDKLIGVYHQMVINENYKIYFNRK